MITYCVWVKTDRIIIILVGSSIYLCLTTAFKLFIIIACFLAPMIISYGMKIALHNIFSLRKPIMFVS